MAGDGNVLVFLLATRLPKYGLRCLRGYGKTGSRN